MAGLDDWAQRFRELDRKWLPTEPIGAPLGERLAATLARRPVVLADVGSDGGVDTRWDALGHKARFLLFEPREASARHPDPRVRLVPHALAAAMGERDLFIAEFAQSSSLLQIDPERVAPFLVEPCFATARRTRVRVSTLDASLPLEVDWLPHFLKVDVEGADLEVLNGANLTLRQHLIGVKVEVAFNAKHVGGPHLGDIDAKLRPLGFELFHVSREAMLRKNTVYGATTRPQLMWGDAVYLLGNRSFQARLQASSDPDALLAAFAAILLLHDAHDYAVEIAGVARTSRRCTNGLCDDIESAARVAAAASPRRLMLLLLGASLAAVVRVSTWPFPPARQMGIWYFRRRWGALFHLLWRMNCRSGALDGSASDVVG
jgi:FkbM family methyltransferase